MSEPTTGAGRALFDDIEEAVVSEYNYFAGEQATIDSILAIEAEARADALREAAERVRALDARSLDDDGDGYGGVEFVHLASVLAIFSEIGTTNGK